ncbi:hypothetical protein G7046_g2881 [Stylonectria norvegica]|nr:hypothetical protein G7046_g2881 [Stylonectria norvegica]
MHAISFYIMATVVAALPSPNQLNVSFPANVECGEVNVFYTGFPGYHSRIIAGGLDPAVVEAGEQNGIAQLVQAGFNVLAVLQGPEQPVSNLASRMRGKRWDVTAVLFDTITQFRESAPMAPIVFNWGATSMVEAVQRHFQFKEDCTMKPGKFYGYEEICSSDVCDKVFVIAPGDVDALSA